MRSFGGPNLRTRAQGESKCCARRPRPERPAYARPRAARSSVPPRRAACPGRAWRRGRRHERPSGRRTAPRLRAHRAAERLAQHVEASLGAADHDRHAGPGREARWSSGARRGRRKGAGRGGRPGAGTARAPGRGRPRGRAPGPNRGGGRPRRGWRGGARRRAPCSQPVAQRHAYSSSASPFERADAGVEGGQEDLLDRALERPDRQALLELAVGGCLVEAVERGEQARRRGWPAAAAAATSMAEEMLFVSRSASRSASISPSSYWRWLPSVRARAGGSPGGAPTCAAWRG